MSIVSSIASEKSNKLVIPYPGKMFRSNISKDNKALCFCINKGYFETDNLETMMSLIDDAKEIETIKLIADLEKVINGGTVVYRQRIFFKSLKHVLNLCKVHCLYFDLADDFHITINSVMNCLDDLKYIERYSRQFKLTIDEWLTNCCIIHIHYLLLNMHMYSELEGRVNTILKDKEGYLDKAPFLASSYSIDTKTSALFLELDTSDRRLYSTYITDKIYLTYGYTVDNVKEDLKRGYFKK